jgi:hypothetical protein
MISVAATADIADIDRRHPALRSGFSSRRHGGTTESRGSGDAGWINAAGVWLAYITSTGTGVGRYASLGRAASDLRNERVADSAGSVAAVGRKAARTRERKRSPIAIRAMRSIMRSIKPTLVDMRCSFNCIRHSCQPVAIRRSPSANALRSPFELKAPGIFSSVAVA